MTNQSIQNNLQITDPYLQIFDFTDDEESAIGYGLPIEVLAEDDLRFLRDFILSSAMYVEQLESFLTEGSDEFWQDRERAYRIITAMLIQHYEYEMDG